MTKYLTVNRQNDLFLTVNRQRHPPPPPPIETLLLVYCSVRDWTRFLRRRIEKYPDSPVHTLSDSLRNYFFPLWRADLFFSGFTVEFACCVWTVAVSGKKKLRIQKYSDTCGPGPKSLP